MKKMQLPASLLFLITVFYTCFIMSCGQIGMPTGGDRDSLPPVLVKANPEPLSTNFDAQRITIQFDEYIQLQNTQSQLLVSPYQKRNPTITSNLRSISIRLRDSLLPNTTYSIQFGNAISDINESNIVENFTYVFSTGPHIDSLQIKGRVEIAETGETDSTLIALLYKNAVDSSVQTVKPDYMARVKSDGSFHFKYLPAGNFKLYVLGDGDGSKTYNSTTETFAFLPDNPGISTTDSLTTYQLYAYQAEKKEPDSKKPATDKGKHLQFAINQSGQQQDLLKDLQLEFNAPLQKIDTTQIILTDTHYVRIPDAVLTVDSTRRKLTFSSQWVPGQNYFLILPQDALEDSTGRKPEKTDSLQFVAKQESDYGSLVLRFTGLSQDSHPRLLLYSGNELFISEAIVNQQWSKRLMPPGDYRIKILWDENNNGVWDPGNYETLLQPEKVLNIELKLNVRANWDNEQDISL